MHDLQWFKDRQDEYIYRKHPEDRGWGIIRNNLGDDQSEYYYELQKYGYEYKGEDDPIR